MRVCQNPGNSRILTFEIILRKVFGAGGRLTRKGYMYTYNWFMMLYSRTQHNIVKQLFSNFKKLRLRNSRNRKNRISLSADKKCINRNLEFYSGTFLTVHIWNVWYILYLKLFGEIKIELLFSFTRLFLHHLYTVYHFSQKRSSFSSSKVLHTFGCLGILFHSFIYLFSR